MSKAAHLKLHGVDVDKLRTYFDTHPAARKKLWTRLKRNALLKKLGCVPDGFADEAYDIALSDAGLAAFQMIEAPVGTNCRQGRLFVDVEVTSRLDNGEHRTVHGMWDIRGMTDAEYDEYESKAAERIKVQGRALNSQRMIRNGETLVQRELPFPEFEH